MMLSTAHAATLENLVSIMSQPYPILVEALTQIAASNDSDQISEIARSAARRILSAEAIALIQSGAGVIGDVRAPSLFMTPALEFLRDPAAAVVALGAVGEGTRSTDCVVTRFSGSDQTRSRLSALPIEEVSEFSSADRLPDTLGEIVAAQTLARAASAAISRCIDLGEQIQASALLQLERDEVRHRLKNVYASAIGLANLSLPREHSKEFALRLRTLAAVHDFLDDKDQNSPCIQLREVLAGVLSPYHDPEMPRILAEGPDIEISSPAAVAVGLLANELATNALKHGSLSVESGQIFIQWTCCDGEISLGWREVGGPEADCVAAASQGTKLMRMIVESQLRGTMEHAVTRSGLSFSVSFPLN